jgi:hypothetical protein
MTSGQLRNLGLSWIPQFYPQITQINADFHRVAHE